MSECNLTAERMPQLLVEALSYHDREITHRHIESCSVCTSEWRSLKETWSLLGELPEEEVPSRVRQRLMAAAGLTPPSILPGNVISFRQRPAFRYVAQAAAVILLAGGSWFAGHRSAPLQIAPSQATINSVTPAQFAIAESRVIPAAQISPVIQGRPNIENVRFVDNNPADSEVAVSFDIKSHMTVTGQPGDKTMVRLLTYVMENEDHMTPSRSRAIDWVRQAYTDRGAADPEIAAALANVLRNDTHEGVRIKAVETLKALPPAFSGETRLALIQALKSDPNPAVRIKAVEALANLVQGGGRPDQVTVDTLRQKASQDDENLYVRVKAAEALRKLTQ
jgi:hypothetical protein